MSNDEALRYPIGRFSPQQTYTPEEVETGIARIRALPAKLEQFVASFSTRQWDTQYRQDGWTGRQVVHHLADSHLNAYIRFKWTLTEETPLIKAYDEKRWALTPETSLEPALSIDLLNSLHAKWTALLDRLTEQEFQRRYVHPETGKEIPLDRMVALYAWHGEHHLGHLRIIAG